MSEKNLKRNKLIKSAITSTTEQCRKQDRLTSDSLSKFSTLSRPFDHMFAAKNRNVAVLYTLNISALPAQTKFNISKIQQFRIIIK